MLLTGNRKKYDFLLDQKYSKMGERHKNSNFEQNLFSRKYLSIVFFVLPKIDILIYTEYTRNGCTHKNHRYINKVKYFRSIANRAPSKFQSQINWKNIYLLVVGIDHIEITVSYLPSLSLQEKKTKTQNQFPHRFLLKIRSRPKTIFFWK